MVAGYEGQKGQGSARLLEDFELYKKILGVILKDPSQFYSISTASFFVWIDFSAHCYLETLQDLSLGFPKRP